MKYGIELELGKHLMLYQIVRSSYMREQITQRSFRSLVEMIDKRAFSSIIKWTPDLEDRETLREYWEQLKTD